MTSRQPKAREDLEFFERTVDDDTIIFVRDPVRGQFFRYNELQAAMLRNLDGVRTPSEIASKLSDEYDVEIPESATLAFVERARSNMLLDVESLRFDPRAAAAAVNKALRRAGYRLEGLGERLRASGDAGAAAGRPLAQALLDLERGDVQGAADHLRRALEVRPDHPTARELRDLVRAAVVGLGAPTTDFPTKKLFNPRPLLQFLSGKVGRFVFGWPGVIAVLAVLGLGIYCSLTLVEFGRADVAPATIAAVFVIRLVVLLIHELSHGLACQHYGGDVTDVGVLLFFYFIPGAYCDTTSAYLFTERRHKVIVQLAGPISTVFCLSSLAILAAVLNADLWLYPAIVVALLVDTFFIIIEVLPFFKGDGYYALSDYYNTPNLRERALNLAGVRLRRAFLGVEEADPEALPPGRARRFVAFAFGYVLVSGLIIYVGLFNLAVPVIERFRGAGLLAVAVFVGFVLYKLVRVPIGSFVRQAWRARRRVVTRPRVYIWAAAASVLAAPWLIPFDVRLDSTFEVKPVQQLDVRAETTGLLDRMLVREGEHVRAGQLLAVLRNPVLDARVTQLDAEVRLWNARIAELRAGPTPEELRVVQRRAGMANSRARADKQRAAHAAALAMAGVGPAEPARLAAQEAVTSDRLSSAAVWHLNEFRAGSHPLDIEAAEAALQRVEVEHALHLRERELLAVRSPIDGVVVTARPEERVGQQFTRGSTILEVHDQRGFIAEVYVPPSLPLAEVHLDARVVLKPYGMPASGFDSSIHSIASRLEEEAASERVLVVRTHAVNMPGARSGIRGRARVYGREKTLAYTYVVLPLERLWKVTLWSMW